MERRSAWVETFRVERSRSLPVAVPGFVIVVRLHRLHSSENPWRLVNPLYLAPLFVSIVLTYGMFWFVWAYFGALIAFACLAGPFVLAEITGSILPIRVRAILIFVAFVGSLVCADLAVHMGELG